MANRSGENLAERLQQLNDTGLPVLLILFRVDRDDDTQDSFQRAVANMLLKVPLLKLIITSRDPNIGDSSSGDHWELCCPVFAVVAQLKRMVYQIGRMGTCQQVQLPSAHRGSLAPR